MNKKVKYKNKIDFINYVSDDCLKNMSSKDKEYLIENPVAIEYHFSYCLYIRNHYIHNRDFSETPFFTHPDDLSSDIIRMILPDLSLNMSMIIFLRKCYMIIKILYYCAKNIGIIMVNILLLL